MNIDNPVTTRLEIILYLRSQLFFLGMTPSFPEWLQIYSQIPERKSLFFHVGMCTQSNKVAETRKDTNKMLKLHSRTSTLQLLDNENFFPLEIILNTWI